jgi:hypothetical protein
MPRAERPSKEALLAYFHEVRALSRDRLDRTTDDEFDRMVTDEHYGPLSPECQFSERRDPFGPSFSKPFPPLS